MNRRKGWGGYQHMVKSRPTHYTYTKMWGKLKYITHWTWCHQPAYMLIHELSNTKTKHHPTRTFPNQRRHFATELHGKFLQSILCRTKNGEIVHLLRRKNVPWCAEAKRLQFLFLRFVCCWQRENMENSVSCVGYLRLWIGSWKAFGVNVPMSEVPQFHGKPTPNWRHLLFNELLCDVYPPR